MVCLALALGWLLWQPVKSRYIERRRALHTEIAKVEDDLRTYRRARDAHVDARQALRDYADRTLGGDLETVDHRLRSRLNRLGEALGLANLSVGTGPVREKETPAKSKFNRRHHAELREEVDFVEVDAWVSGQGSLEQALRLVHVVDGDPWIKRLNQLRLVPRDNGDRFGVTLRLTTLFLPGREPETPPIATEPAPGFERYAQLIERNPFRVPPKAEPKPPPQPVQAAAKPPVFPFDQWVITGVVEGPDGPEVWLRNRKSNASRRLLVGHTIDRLMLAAADGDMAEFADGDRRFKVLVGGRLSDRQ